MARIRTVKPEILDDEATASLSHAAWRLFVSVLMLADDGGNFRADVRWLAPRTFWARPETDTEAALVELAAANLVALYTVRGQRYAHVRSFTKHQRIDRPSKERLPTPDQSDEPSSSPRRVLDEPSRSVVLGLDRGLAVGSEGNGREGKGGETRAMRATPEEPSPFPPQEPEPAETVAVLDPGAELLKAWVARWTVVHASTPTWSASDRERLRRHFAAKAVAWGPARTCAALDVLLTRTHPKVASHSPAVVIAELDGCDLEARSAGTRKPDDGDTRRSLGRAVKRRCACGCAEWDHAPALDDIHRTGPAACHTEGCGCPSFRAAEATA